MNIVQTTNNSLEEVVFQVQAEEIKLAYKQANLRIFNYVGILLMPSYVAVRRFTPSSVKPYADLGVALLFLAVSVGACFNLIIQAKRAAKGAALNAEVDRYISNLPKNSHKETALITQTVEDTNGVFQNNVAMAVMKLQVAKYFDLYQKGVANIHEITQAHASTANELNRKIKLWIMCTHGEQDGLILSSEKNEEGVALGHSVVLGYEQHHLKEAFSHLKPDADIILISCDTAKKSRLFPSFEGVAQRIANYAKESLVYACKGAVERWVLNIEEKEGKITTEASFFDKFNRNTTALLRKKESPKKFVEHFFKLHPEMPII